MVRVLITGGSGSIAQVLADELLNLNFDVLLATRQSNGEYRAPAIQVGDVDCQWQNKIRPRGGAKVYQYGYA
jgi:nucleoside-diphosphate-sugar epimerase